MSKKNTKKNNVYHVPMCPVWDARRKVPKGMIPDYSEYKVKECRHPEIWGCRGCEYNQVPELSDGGCKLTKWGKSNIPKDEHRMLIEENYQ